ncbi:MAG: serine hydrolase domain-containing protein [Chloroflexota bacterium]
MDLKTTTLLETLIPHLEKHLPRLMEKAGVPGLSVALIRQAELVWAQGFGVKNVETKAPVTTDTIFEACSLSKVPFAYAALKLYELGELDIDAPLSQYLPAPYFDGEPNDNPVTAGQVLSHTAGFPNWRPKSWSELGWPPAGVPLELHFTPGDHYSYSGEGFMYLQRVIEQLTGKTGEAFMQTQLLKPLGMERSTYVWADADDPDLASNHDYEGNLAQKFLRQDMISAASLHTTPTEYANFMTAMMNPSSENDAHLSSRSTDQMLSSQVQVNDLAPWHGDWPDGEIVTDERVSWGLGWGLQHHENSTSFWHWGDNFSATAFAAGFKEEGLGIIIMANSGNGYGLFEDVCLETIGGEYPGLWWLKRLFAKN